MWDRGEVGPGLGSDPFRHLLVQADTLAFTLDLTAALLQNERPRLAALLREKAEAARSVIREVQAVR
jgi:hypothetical protein